MADTGVGNVVPSRASPFVRGQTLGRYLVIDTVGAGGMGVVVAAYDPDLDRKIAIKIIHPSVGEADADARARLLREARAMARLSHPNVVTVFDVGILDERVFVAMEYVEHTLERWLAAAKRTWREILDAFVAAGRGLCAAHDAGLVHRDFKPSNVLVGRDARVRVTDFGLVAGTAGFAESARAPATAPDTLALAETGASPLTRAGAILGTPLYMAPEQHLGTPADARADQFAFCVSLYMALYQAHPFDARSVSALASSVVAGNVRQPVPSDDTAVPGWIWPSLRRGLEADPSARWPSLAELLTALEQDPARQRSRQLAGRALFDFGRARREDGDFHAAEIALREATTSAELSGDRVLAARSLAELAEVVAVVRRDTPEAMELLGRAIAGRTDEIAYELELSRAVVLETTEQLEDARVAASRAVELARDRLGSEHLELAACLAQLGEVLQGLRRFEDAQRCELEALAIAARKPITGDRLRARVLGTLAEIADRQGRFEDALQRYREHCAVLEQVFGREHLRVAQGYSQLGDMLRRMDHPDESLAYHERSAAIAERTLGPQSPQYTTALLNVALAQIGRGEHAAGLAVAERALAIVEETGNRDDLSIADHLEAVATALERSAPRDALALFTRVLEVRRGAPAVDDEAMGRSYNNIGATHLRVGELAEGVAVLDRARQIYEQVFGPDHPETADVYANLGSGYSTLGDGERAAAWYERALSVRVASLGPEHSDVARTREWLSVELFRLRRYADALPHFETQLASSDDLDIATHAGLLAGQGDCLLALGRPADAVAPLSRAAELRDSLPELDPGMAAHARIGLAFALWAIGERSRAIAEARKSRAGFAASGPQAAINLAEVERWLAERDATS